MGGSFSKELVSGLDPYSFDLPFSHNIDWSEKYVFLIESEYELSIASKALLTCDVLYMDCEGENFGSPLSRIGLVQVAANEEYIFLFDVITLPTCNRFLRKVLQDDTILKVFHDCSGDGAALYSMTEVVAEKAFDTQVAQKIDETPRDISLSHATSYSLASLYKKVTLKDFPKINTNTYAGGKWFERRPMSENMVKYAAADVMVLPEIYEAQKQKLTGEEIKRCFEETSKNMIIKIPDLRNCITEMNVSQSSRPNQLIQGDRFRNITLSSDDTEDLNMFHQKPCYQQPRQSGQQLQQSSSFLGTALAFGAAVVGAGALAMMMANREEPKKERKQ